MHLIANSNLIFNKRKYTRDFFNLDHKFILKDKNLEH